MTTKRSVFGGKMVGHPIPGEFLKHYKDKTRTEEEKRGLLCYSVLNFIGSVNFPCNYCRCLFLRNSKPEILNWNCCFGHDSVKVGNTASLSSKLDEKEDGGVDFLPGVQKRVDYHFLGDEIQVLRHSVKKLFSCLRNFKWVVQFQTLFQQSPMVVLHSFRFTVIINYFAKLILIQHIWRKIFKHFILRRICKLPSPTPTWKSFNICNW